MSCRTPIIDDSTAPTETAEKAARSTDLVIPSTTSMHAPSDIPTEEEKEARIAGYLTVVGIHTMVTVPAKRLARGKWANAHFVIRKSRDERKVMLRPIDERKGGAQYRGSIANEFVHDAPPVTRHYVPL